MNKQRKHYTAEEKVAILRRHLLEHEPISKVCDEAGLQPAKEIRKFPARGIDKTPVAPQSFCLLSIQ